MKSIGFLVQFDGKWRFTHVEPIGIPAARRRQIVDTGTEIRLL